MPSFSRKSRLSLDEPILLFETQIRPSFISTYMIFMTILGIPVVLPFWNGISPGCLAMAIPEYVTKELGC